jgi:hypothetical protein
MATDRRSPAQQDRPRPHLHLLRLTRSRQLTSCRTGSRQANYHSHGAASSGCHLQRNRSRRGPISPSCSPNLRAPTPEATTAVPAAWSATVRPVPAAAPLNPAWVVTLTGWCMLESEHTAEEAGITMTRRVPADCLASARRVAGMMKSGSGQSGPGAGHVGTAGALAAGDQPVGHGPATKRPTHQHSAFPGTWWPARGKRLLASSR